jgi:hypothetical protein
MSTPPIAFQYRFNIAGCGNVTSDGVIATARCEQDFQGQPHGVYKDYAPMRVFNEEPPPPVPPPKPYDVDGGKILVPARIEYANMCADMYYVNGRIECIPFGSYLQVCSNVRITPARELQATCYDGQPQPNYASYDMNNWKGELLAYTNNTLVPYKQSTQFQVPGALYYTDYLTSTPTYQYDVAIGFVGGIADTKKKPVTYFWIKNQENAGVLSQFTVGRKCRIIGWSYETGIGSAPSPYMTITQVINPRAGATGETQISFSPQLMLVPNTVYKFDFSYIFTCKVETADRRNDVTTVVSSFSYVTAANAKANNEFNVGRRFRILKWNGETGDGRDMSVTATVTRIVPFLDDAAQTQVIFSPPMLLKPSHVTTFQMFY